MNIYEVGWYESYYEEIEAETYEQAAQIIDDRMSVKAETVPTFQGLRGDISVWEIKPEIEVDNSVIFNYNTDEMDYEVLSDD
jgi:hypothetical protein